ncbi:MAG: OmpH family outer membrane protein [Melioribacteraceae bacterium]|nr:OmpH family outer membrane protein [Melioribacteraceae bacterium]MCF8264056.1 OmpH family outer membrane protein [Melioribacteraceae bacterium]MCF8411868.1 OmpH family outer membrane protein [Melioribacteraceae bacterium]
MIAYVNSEIILAQYPPAIKAQSDLDALVQKWYAKRDTMTVQLQQLYQTAQKNADKMTEEELQQTQQQLLVRQQEVEKFTQQKFGQQNGELYQKQQELLGPVQSKIREAIDKVRVEEKFHFVFDKVGDAFLLSADSEFDFTYKVLDKLKRGK